MSLQLLICQASKRAIGELEETQTGGPVEVSGPEARSSPNCLSLSRSLQPAELLHVLMLPDFERADRIGEFWGNLKSRAFAELLIDCEEDRTLRRCSSGCCGRTTAVVGGPAKRGDHRRATPRSSLPSRRAAATSTGRARRAGLGCWPDPPEVLARLAERLPVNH